MSSDLPSVVASLQFGDYISLVVPVACIYDYILTFSQEVDYIWNKSWGFVSVIFILARYLGLTVAVLSGLYGSIFIPGPLLVGTVLLFLNQWAFVIFLAASDIVMILRVYAMYDKSRIVLGVLMVFYTSEVVLYTVSAAYYNNPINLTISVPQVLNMSFCNEEVKNKLWTGDYKLIPRVILSALLFIFAVSRLCIDLYRSYQMTKCLQVNRYINLLVREGILYFLAHVLYIISYPQTETGLTVSVISTVMMFTLSPRFIMSVRELHMSTVINVGIDSGFGIGKSQPSQILASSGAVSSVGFTDSETAFGEVEMEDRR